MATFSLSVLKLSAPVGWLKKFSSPQKSALVSDQCLPSTPRPSPALPFTVSELENSSALS